MLEPINSIKFGEAAAIDASNDTPIQRLAVAERLNL